MTKKKTENKHNLMYYAAIWKYKCVICGQTWAVEKTPVWQKCTKKNKKNEKK